MFSLFDPRIDASILNDLEIRKRYIAGVLILLDAFENLENIELERSNRNIDNHAQIEFLSNIQDKFYELYDTDEEIE